MLLAPKQKLLQLVPFSHQPCSFEQKEERKKEHPEDQFAFTTSAAYYAIKIKKVGIASISLACREETGPEGHNVHNEKTFQAQTKTQNLWRQAGNDRRESLR